MSNRGWQSDSLEIKQFGVCQIWGGRLISQILNNGLCEIQGGRLIPFEPECIEESDAARAEPLISNMLEVII